MNDYSKLRPYTQIERCECTSVNGLLLVYLFTSNPIHCSTCRKEIDPERLNLSTLEVEEVASCLGTYGALYDLWLDSGEYESFAKAKLIDPKGQVNLKGMALAQKLSDRWPTYYWWFYDTDDGTPHDCPSCHAILDQDVLWGTGKCDQCRVIV